jgi:hypothetical protein
VIVGAVPFLACQDWVGRVLLVTRSLRLAAVVVAGLFRAYPAQDPTGSIGIGHRPPHDHDAGRHARSAIPECAEKAGFQLKSRVGFITEGCRRGILSGENQRAS